MRSYAIGDAWALVAPMKSVWSLPGKSKVSGENFLHSSLFMLYPCGYRFDTFFLIFFSSHFYFISCVLLLFLLPVLLLFYFILEVKPLNNSQTVTEQRTNIDVEIGTSYYTHVIQIARH